MIRDRDYATPRHRQRALGPRIPRSCIHSPKDRRHSPACRGACYATAGVVPYRSRIRTRTVAVPQTYRSGALGVPKLQVALQFGFAPRPVYQAFSLTRSGVEIASQAEYAGSIPVIGSDHRKRLYT